MRLNFILFPLSATLLLISAGLCPLPAQDMPPNILQIETEEYHPGEPLKIRATVIDDGQITVLRLFFRRPGELEFDFVDFQPEFDYYVAIIHPEFLDLGKIEYYVSAEDNGGNTRTSPEINPDINPYEFEIIIQVEEGRPTNVQVLSPEPGSILPQGAELIIVSLFDPDDDTDIESIRVYVDGKDVTEEAQVSRDLITYAPIGRLPSGTHRVEVHVRDKEGNESPVKRVEFRVEPFRAEKRAQLKWNADFSLESQYDKYSGKEQPVYRPVDRTIPRLRLNGEWGWLRADGELYYNMYMDDNARSLSEQRQTLNRYRFKMQTKPLTVVFGDANPRFSELTIKGTRIRGVSGDFKLGFFGLSAFWGESRNKVNPYQIDEDDSVLVDTIIDSINLDTTYIYEKGVGTPTYKRDSYGVRTTLGYENLEAKVFNKAQIGFNYLRFTDDIGDSAAFRDEIIGIGGNEFANLDADSMAWYLQNVLNIDTTDTVLWNDYWERWELDHESVEGKLGRPKDNIVGSMTLDLRFFKNTYLTLEGAFSLMSDNMYGSRERIDELYEDQEAGEELDDADKIILDIDKAMKDYFDFEVNDELIHTFSPTELWKPTLFADLRTPLYLIPTNLRVNYRRIPETYNSLGNPSLLKDVSAFKVDTRTRFLRNRVILSLGGERRDDNLYYAKEITTRNDILSAGVNLVFPSYPSLNFAYRLNSREGEKDTTEYNIGTTGDTISVNEYSLTATDSKTGTFNIGSGYMFTYSEWRANVNTNIMLMKYDDSKNEAYNFSNQSYMVSAGMDAPWPWRIDWSYGYSVNDPEASGMKSTIYNIFNSRFSYYFRNRTLTTFAGLDLLSGKKDMDATVNYKIDNVKRSIKAGVKWKVSPRMSLSFQGENIDFNDGFKAADYINTSYTENRVTFRFNYRM